jgi:hypothetical protein
MTDTTDGAKFEVIALLTREEFKALEMVTPERPITATRPNPCFPYVYNGPGGKPTERMVARLVERGFLRHKFTTVGMSPDMEFHLTDAGAHGVNSLRSKYETKKGKRKRTGAR